MRELAHLSLILVVALALALIGVPIALDFWYSRPTGGTLDSLGKIGDFANVLALVFLGASLLLQRREFRRQKEALDLQRREMRLQRDEMELQRKELEDANRLHERQLALLVAPQFEFKVQGSRWMIRCRVHRAYDVSIRDPEDEASSTRLGSLLRPVPSDASKLDPITAQARGYFSQPFAFFFSGASLEEQRVVLEFTDKNGRRQMETYSLLWEDDEYFLRETEIAE